MTLSLRSATVLSLALLASNAALGDVQQPMNCEIGPVKKMYGSNLWLVYSCTDNQTVVIVSDKDSPAMPYYFTFYIKGGRYTLNGEGTGSKAATDAAYTELSNFGKDDIQRLISETQLKK
jgi:hypothetical protein